MRNFVLGIAVGAVLGGLATSQAQITSGGSSSRTFTVSLTPTQIAAAIGAAEQTFTVTGLTTADTVAVNTPAGQTALCPMTSARVSAANTLAVTFGNLAVALCTPVAGTYTVLAIR